MKTSKTPKRSVNIRAWGREPVTARGTAPGPQPPTMEERNMRAQRAFRELERDVAHVMEAAATEAGVRP